MHEQWESQMIIRDLVLPYFQVELTIWGWLKPIFSKVNVHSSVVGSLSMPKPSAISDVIGWCCFERWNLLGHSSTSLNWGGRNSGDGPAEWWCSSSWNLWDNFHQRHASWYWLFIYISFGHCKQEHGKPTEHLIPLVYDFGYSFWGGQYTISWSIERSIISSSWVFLCNLVMTTAYWINWVSPWPSSLASTFILISKTATLKVGGQSCQCSLWFRGFFFEFCAQNQMEQSLHYLVTSYADETMTRFVQDHSREHDNKFSVHSYRVHHIDVGHSVGQGFEAWSEMTRNLLSKKWISKLVFRRSWQPWLVCTGAVQCHFTLRHCFTSHKDVEAL